MGLLNEVVGPYWAQSNAEFDAGNPGLLQRAARTINPVTALGSALGDMHTAAGQGDVVGMALATANALPGFATTRTVLTTGTGAVKAGIAQVPNLQALLAGLTANIGVNEVQNARQDK